MRLLPDAFDKVRSAWRNMQLLVQSRSSDRKIRDGGVKRRSGVIHLSCFDKALLSFEINCTGQRIGCSGIFSVKRGTRR